MQVHLLLAHILGKLTAKPVDGSQGNRVPAPKSVHCQWGEGDPLIGAPLFVLPHLSGVMGALYRGILVILVMLQVWLEKN